MSSSARHAATASSDSEVGDTDWTTLNASVLSSDDNSRAIVELTYGSTSYYAKLVDFGFTLPSGATIDGIKVTMKCLRPAGDNNIIDYSVRLVRDGLLELTDKATSTPLPTSENERVYGGDSDLWDTSWTPADVNDSGFGVAISLSNWPDLAEGSPGDGEIDEVVIEIYYTAPLVLASAPTGVALGSVPATAAQAVTDSLSPAGLATAGGKTDCALALDLDPTPLAVAASGNAPQFPIRVDVAPGLAVAVAPPAGASSGPTVRVTVGSAVWDLTRAVAAIGNTIEARPAAGQWNVTPAVGSVEPRVAQSSLAQIVGLFGAELSIGAISQLSAMAIAVGGPASSHAVGVTASAVGSVAVAGPSAVVRPGLGISPRAAGILGSSPATSSITTIHLAQPESIELAASGSTIVGGQLGGLAPAGLQLGVPTAGTVAAIAISPPAAAAVLSSSPATSAITTIHLAWPQSIELAASQCIIAGGQGGGLTPAGLQLGAPAAGSVAAIAISPLAAAAILSSSPAASAVTTIHLARPQSIELVASQSTIIGGQAGGLTPAGLQIGAPAAGSVAAITISPPAAAAILSGSPATSAVTTIHLARPHSIELAASQSAIIGGQVGGLAPAGLQLGVPAAGTVAAIVISPPAAAGILRSLPATSAVTTIHLARPQSIELAASQCIIAGGQVGGLTPAGLQFGAPAAGTVAAIAINPPAAAGILSSSPATPAVTTIHLARPQSIELAASQCIIAGGQVGGLAPAGLQLGAPAAGTVAAIAISPPAAAAVLSSSPATSSVTTIHLPSPSAIVSWEMPAVAALGHDFAPLPAAQAVAPRASVITAAIVATGSPVSSAAAAASQSVSVGVVSSRPPAAISSAGLGWSVTVGAAPLPPAAGVLIWPLGIRGVVGALASAGSTVATLAAIGPAGVGAVHIAAPDFFTSVDGHWWTSVGSRVRFTIEDATMSLAKELMRKTAAETKDLTIDCAGALAAGETIESITATHVSPGPLTITGVEPNATEITEPGRRPIQPGESIRAFVGGGIAGTTYTITFTYETSAGQVLEAAVRVMVIPPA